MNQGDINTRLVQFWSARTQRERMILMAGMTMLVLAVMYLLLIDPALSGRRHLRNDLPVLRQQAAQIQDLVRQSKMLAIKSAADLPELTEENIRASLQNDGLTPQSVMLNGKYVQVKLSAASFSGTLHWLDKIQKSELLSVVEASLKTTSEPGKIDADLSLRQPGNE